jgi:hypothetical protein
LDPTPERKNHAAELIQRLKIADLESGMQTWSQAVNIPYAEMSPKLRHDSL